MYTYIYILLFVFVVILLIMKKINYQKRYNNSLNFKNYELMKLHITKTYSDLLLHIEVDFRNSEIKPVNLWEIKESIDNLSQDIYNFHDYLDWINLAEYQNFVSKERIWFKQFVSDFHLSVKKWIDIHAKELEILEQNISNQINETSDISWKWALSLTHISLWEHLLKLEQIKDNM